MEDQVLKELKAVRKLLSELIGTEELPTRQKYSKEAIETAAKEFKTLSINRGKWIENGDISKFIKGAPYGSGKFIIEKFGFANYFTRGKTHYFNKKDLIAFGNELKKRNISLKRYMELLADQEKFQKYVDSAKKGKKGLHFQIPDGLKDIETSPYPHPPEDIIRNHLKNLYEELEKDKSAEYIDLYYNKTYAMFKHEYFWDRYLKPDLKKQCKRWIDNFNYANYALKKIEGIEQY
jgi:hypothetical protein